MNKDAIYNLMPPIIQNVLCSVHGYQIIKRRFGGTFPQILQEIEARNMWTREELEEYRERMFLDVIRNHCVTTPFYREWFKKHGISVNQINSLSDLSVLPILSKGDIQNSMDLFVNDAVPGSARIPIHTSGTTGGGLRFYETRESERRRWATWWRFRKIHDLGRSEWCAYFGGRSVVPIRQNKEPYWRVNYPARQILFSAYHLSDRTARTYLDHIVQTKARWWHGYPSIVSLLCRYAEQLGVDLKGKVTWISTGAENLWKHQSDFIERVTGVKPIQHYNQAELVANISECKCGKLHIDEDYSIVELLPTDMKDTYRIVGTSLINPACPFVRYDTEDLVLMENDTCSCGLHGRVVSRIDGRKEEYVVTKNGAKVGRMDHIFKDMVHVSEAQIIQKEPGTIEVLLHVRPSFTEAAQEELKDEFLKRLGSDMNVSFRRVDSIPRSRSGKLRFVVTDNKRED